MCSLNYKDLQYLIIEYDIASMEHQLREKEHRRQEQQGIEIIEATNDQILAMHQK